MAVFDGKDTIILSNEELNELNKGFCGNDLDFTGKRIKIAKEHQVKLEPDVPENPWENLNLNSTQIIANDPAEITAITNLASKLAGNTDYELHLDSVPEPFWGDIVNADVFILSGNPGYGDSKIEKSFIGNTDLIQKTHDNLEQTSPTNLTSPNLLWLESNKPIRNPQGDLHPGYEYWEDKTKELRKAVGDDLNICIIEYFPYHSQMISDEKKECANELSSSKFVDYYIEKAIKDGKWIVILRCKSEWLNRIKGTYWKDSKLKKYKKEHSDKVLITKGQQMFITAGNLKREIDMDSKAGEDTWNEFVEACTCKLKQ